MRPSSFLRSKDSFTLVELLVVIGILAILTAAVVIALNPAELLKQSRDSKRATDLAAINNAIKILLTQSPDVSLGNSSTVYISLADSSSTCGSYALPMLPSGWRYSCVTAANLVKADGAGWIPVNFLNGASQLPALPVDPQNDAATRKYYAYAASNGKWELASSFESAKYAAKEANDGGADPAGYEAGSAMSLLPFASGLVGYWNFDEPSGTTAYDLSGWGNNGTMYSSSTQAYLETTVGCKSLGCASLDGVDDYINAGAGNSLNVTGDLTIGAWIKVGAASANSSVAVVHRFAGGCSSTGGYCGYRFGADAGGNAVLGYGNSGGSYVSVPKYGLSLAGAWNHIYFVKGGSSVVLYLNGQPIQETAISNGITGSLNASVYIGYNGWNGYWFGGQLDDLRIYNRALSAAEIQAIYNAAQ
jgi:type II secretory pathway pseudopilin PulG